MRRFSALFACAIVATSSAALADVQHTVARGHTIEAIANRYHVTTKAIIDANKLKDVKHLQPGDVLTIPGVKESDDKDKKAKKGDEKKDEKHGKDDKHAKDDKHGKTASTEKSHGRETTSYAMKPKTPGVVHAKRVATKETFDIKVDSRKDRVSPVALKTFEKMMRSPGGMAHPIDARLVALVGIVSNHFGSRPVEVISGFRPYTPTQYNPHSNHMHGKAIDFRVVGVPNEALRDFCRTLKNVGCGYYPNSVFVHMDVRDTSAFWIDYSKPGEPPRYNAPNAGADEGTSDVHGDGKPSDTTETTETPSKEPEKNESGTPKTGAAALPAAPAKDE